MAFYYENLLQSESIDFSSELVAYDSLQSIYSRLGRKDEVYRIQRKTLSLLQERGGLWESIKKCRIYRDELQKVQNWNFSDSSQYFELSLSMGLSEIAAGMYEDAISLLLHLLTQDPPDWCLARIYSCLGYVFMKNDRLAQSMNYHRKAVEVFRSMPDDSVKMKQGIFIYDHLAGLYYRKSEYDSAIYCIEQAIECAGGNTSQCVYSFHNMGLIYVELGEWAKAEEYWKKTVSLSGKNREFYLKAVAMQNLANLYMKMGSLESAESLLREVILLAGNRNFNDLMATAMVSYAHLLYEQGDCAGFKDYFQAGIEKMDSLSGKAIKERMDLLNYQYELYRMEVERKVLEQDLQLAEMSNQKKSLLVAGGVFFLVLALVSLLYLLFRKLRQGDELKSMTREIELLKEILRRRLAASKVELASSLEVQNRKLASGALYLSQVQDLISQVLSELETIDKMDWRGRKSKISVLKKRVKNAMGKVDVWKEFRIYFEQVHQGFYRKLLKEAPDLSPMEQRLCCLLVLRLTQREISELTNRSPRSVQSMMYRIRKKLGIPSDMKLSTYLSQFL